MSGPVPDVPTGWPVAQLDPVQRLSVLARAMPHAHLVERTLDAPFEKVWQLAVDFEAGVPAFETLVRDLRVVSREAEPAGVPGERVQLEVRVGPLRGPMEARLQPGFCVMRGLGGEIGMAARPAGPAGQTHFAHYEAHRRWGRLAKPYFRWALPRELAKLEALARRG